jgi:hypothetical protein
MCFYGVTHDRHIHIVEDGDIAVRVTVSASFEPAGADRRIGV